jgi:hypothetical protein
VVRASAQLEMDFIGSQLPVGVTQPYNGSEGAFFTNPTFRTRHMNLKVETPIVDILMGQYWQLFGWQSAYQPNTVELQGVPGEIYSRTPQLRISKTVKAQPVTFEVAIAAARPVQRDNGFPDGEGGIRFALDSWTAIQTIGQNGTQISPLSVAATGLLRRVSVNELSPTPKVTNENTMSAFAVDAFIPILPGKKGAKPGSVSPSDFGSFALNGEFATGYGFADMYTGLTGGIGFPPQVPANPMAMPPVAAVPFNANIDTGIVTYDANGGIHGIRWTTTLVGAQYYFPGLDGNLWISGNYSHVESPNIDNYVPASITASNCRASTSSDHPRPQAPVARADRTASM